MTAKWHDQGENRVLSILLGAQAVDGAMYMGLYTNTTELGEDAELADLVEPSGYGYARKTLTRGSWTITGSIAIYALQTFTAAGGDWGDIAGYFIATSLDSSGKLIASEHFATALDVKDGKGIKITPKITVS
jgi:hypothetical protein